MSENTQTTETTTAKTRHRWNLDNAVFVATYQASDSAKEVAQKLNIPVSVCNSRAAYLRGKNVQLKHFDGKRTRIDVAALNQLVAKDQNGEATTTNQ